MRTVVLVQARLGSTRLPGKVLMPLAGAPLLQRMIERLRAAETPSEIVVATTTDPADDAIVALCRAINARVFRGHPTDLLDRHLRAAEEARAEVVVKIPSDCPVVDPRVVDRVIGAHLSRAGEVDFTGNLHPPSWPDGMDVEAMPLEILRVAHREAKKPHEREHTTPFFWDQPARFRLQNVASGLVDRSKTHRLTIDYPEDYALLARVFDALFPVDPYFSVERVVEHLDAHPELLALNAKYNGVNWYRHHLADLATVDASHTRNPA